MDGGAGQQAGALPGHVRDAVPALREEGRKQRTDEDEEKNEKPTHSLTHLLRVAVSQGRYRLDRQTDLSPTSLGLVYRRNVALHEDD